MKKIVIIIIAGLIGALVVYGITASKNGSPAQADSFASIQADVSSGAKLYDVRTPSEYASGHFENATNMPLQSMQAGVLPDVPKGQKIYVYCQSGNRSSQATATLRQAGFTNVTDLGGLQDVQSIGGKLTQ